MSIDANELNRKMVERLEEVCLHLFPNGKRKGHHWMVGNISGASGESLQITLVGSAAGRFMDFSDQTVKGATPLWLWSKARNLSFKEAIKEAAEFMGISEHDYGIKRHRPKTYLKPEKSGVVAPNQDSPVMNYLVMERKLDPAVVTAAKVGETEDKQAIVFTFADWDDETKRWLCAHRKFLKLARPDGKKDSWSSKGTKRCLYAKNLVGDDVSELVITEGEIDALSWNSVSIPAVSVPNGVSDMEWIDIDWDWLARFEKIYISTDMDEPGRAAAQEICKRLGLHRSYIVELPKKDANEMLVAGATKEDFRKCLDASKQIELDEIKRPDEFRKEVLEHYITDPSLDGWQTPWSPDLGWRIRRGEFTVLSGFSGSGKALALDTPIPTPSGWTTMGALFPGDEVFDEHGKPCKVVFATPVQLDRKCYRVTFSDGSQVVADADHLWETWGHAARSSRSRQIRKPLRPKKTSRSNPQKHKLIKPSVLTTEEIRRTLIYATNSRSELEHAIPVAGQLDLPVADLTVDPYCLGAWLGDGHSQGGVMTCDDKDFLVMDQFVKAGYSIKQYARSFNRALGAMRTPVYGVAGLTTKLRSLGLINNKHIPQCYLRSSREQRLALLQGLMDTDGTIQENGTMEFCTSIEVMANQFKELLATLGIRSVVRREESYLYEKRCADRFRISFTTDIHSFRLPRKLSRIREVGFDPRRRYRYISSVEEVESVPVKCIQVDSPSHLYLCGREFIPTHNTQGLNQLMVTLINQGCKVLDASFEIRASLTLYYMSRCALGKKHASEDEINGCIGWLNESMFFLDCIGTVSVDRLMSAMEYARKRHGIDVFVIDSLFKCGLSPDDFGAQRAFADRLTSFCNNTGAHVILVAHSRKTQNGNEFSVPTKADVAGSSDLTNAAFNVIIFWRNKLKKRKLDEARQTNNVEELSKWLAEHDGKILIDKQRFGEGEEGEIYTFFDKDSCQFSTMQNRVIPYFETK